MKKNYITPNYKVVDLGSEEVILSGSNGVASVDPVTGNIDVNMGGDINTMTNGSGGDAKSQNIFDDEW